MQGNAILFKHSSVSNLEAQCNGNKPYDLYNNYKPTLQLLMDNKQAQNKQYHIIEDYADTTRYQRLQDEVKIQVEEKPHKMRLAILRHQLQQL